MNESTIKLNFLQQQSNFLESKHFDTVDWDVRNDKTY